MARTITLKGNTKNLEGDGVAVGQPAPDVTLAANDLSPRTLADYKGKTVILCVMPSVDTPVCDTETRRFNQEAAALGDDVVILAVTVDTPFAQKRWCGAAGVDNVETLSDFKDHNFGKAFGLRIEGVGIMARAIYVINKDGVITYEQLVGEVADEPDYAAVLEAAKSA